MLNSGRHLALFLLVLLLVQGTPVYGQAVLDALLARSQAGAMDTGLVNAIQERAGQANLSPQQTAALLMPSVLLDEQGLPTRMVLQKTLEGLAKQVPFPTLQDVLGRFQTHTEAAAVLAESWLAEDLTQRLLQLPEGAEERGGLIETLTVAHMGASSETELQRLLERLPREVNRPSVTYHEVRAALHVWPDLHATTERADTPSDFIIVALNSGFSERDFQQVPGALRTAQQNSQRSSIDLLSLITQQLGQGTTAARVLRQLRQGNF